MSINGIGSYQLSANSLYPEQTQTANAVESDGDVDRSRVTAPVDTTGKSGLFATAISQTLFQIGVTPTAANVATGAAPTGTQQQALNSFAQNLFGALQTVSQDNGTAATVRPGGTSKGSTKSASTSSSTASSASSSAATQPSNLSINSSLQNRLQNLIQELGTSSQDADSSSSSSDGQALEQLQQSFQSLVSSQGGRKTQSTSLTNFLQTLSENLQDAPTSGTLINVQA